MLPLLKMPIASARSRLGNHSVTTFTPPEKLPHSPVPIQNRKIEKCQRFDAKTCAPVAADHDRTANVKPVRTPQRSMSIPIGNSPLIMPN